MGGGFAKTRAPRVRLVFAIKRLAHAAGGAERVLCTLCSELVARGHDITILTFDQPGGQAFYPLDARVRRLDLGIGKSERAATLGETWQRMKVLRRVLRAERPDVVVGFMHSMFVPLAFAMAGTGIPVLGSEHIVPEHYRTRPLQYGLLIIAALFLTTITVLSETIRVRYPITVRCRMRVVPNPVALASAQTEADAPQVHSILLCIGRLEAQKDHGSLIRAFAHISPVFPDWQLLIVGEGSLRSELALLIDNLGMAERIVMPGVMANINEAYQSARAFVIPSRYEAFGLVTAEAMSYGLPVIGFADCPGTNELIVDGLNGLLVEPGEDRVASLAQALSVLLSNPELRHRLGTAGRQSIIACFSPGQVCDQWEGLLQECRNPFAHRLTNNKNDGVT